MNHKPMSADVGAMYDHLTDLLTAALGGSIHLGYWEDDNDDSPVATASERMTKRVADQLDVTHGQHVLDVGCGSGKPAMQIATDRDVHVTGITVSAFQLQRALERTYAPDLSEQVSFHLADAMDLAFDDASFDGAYAIESILHMKDKDVALGHIARVLRPGARLVIADLCLDKTADKQDVELAANLCQIFSSPTLPTVDDYLELLGRAGFTLLEVVDIRENVERSYGLLASAIRRAATSSDDRITTQLAGAAAIIEQFGELKSAGYHILTAVRA